MNKNTRTNNLINKNSSIKKSKKNVNFLRKNKINKLRGGENDIETILDIIATKNPNVLGIKDDMLRFNESNIYSFNNENLKTILEALQSNTTITTVNLIAINFDIKCIVALSDLLKHNTIITEFYFRENDINIDGIKTLLKALQGNTTLTELSFRNNIGDIGATALAEGLQDNTTLKKLYISYNNIGDIGATSLAAVLPSMTALKKLYISYNNIGDIGATALLAVLPSMTALTELHINNNKITVIGAKALATALQGNTTLTILDISNNMINAEGIKYLSNILNSMSAITTLNISNNINWSYSHKFKIDKTLQAFTVLAEVLKENKTITNINIMQDSLVKLNFSNYTPIELIILEVLKVNTTLKQCIFSPKQNLFDPILNLQTFTSEEDKEIDKNINFIKNKLQYKNLKNNNTKEKVFNKNVADLVLIDRYFKRLTYNNYNNGKESMKTLATNETYIVDLHGSITLQSEKRLLLLPDNINVIFLGPILYQTYVACNFLGKFKTEINKNLKEYLQNPYCFNNPNISNIFKEAIIYYGGQYCIELNLTRDDYDFVTGISRMDYNNTNKQYKSVSVEKTGARRYIGSKITTLSELLRTKPFSEDKKYTILFTSCREITDSSRDKKELADLLVFYEQQLKLLNFKIYYDINTKAHNNTLNNRYSKCSLNTISPSSNVNQVQKYRSRKGTIKSRRHIDITNNTIIQSNSFSISLKEIKILIEDIKNEDDETLVFDKLCNILNINKIKTRTNKSFYNNIQKTLREHKRTFKNHTINNLSNEVYLGASSIFLSSKHNNQILNFIFKDKPELRDSFLDHCDKTYKMLIPFNKLKMEDMIKIKEELNDFNQQEFTDDINNFIKQPSKQLWRDLSLKYHPDRNKINNVKTATKKIQLINKIAVIYDINKREATNNNIPLISNV